MIVQRWCYVALTLCLVIGGRPRLLAEEDSALYWPQFRGPDRTGVSADENLSTPWPEDGPHLVWQATGAGRGYASVAISQGRFFTVGDAPSTAEDEDAYLLCYDVANGEQLWRHRIGKPWTDGPNDWHSSRSTPTIDGANVFALSAHGDLVCVDAESGKENWRKKLKEDFDGKKGDDWGYSESVLIDGDRLICTPGGESKTMVALDKLTGELIWSAAREDDRGAGHASIVISEVGGTRVYVQTTASGALGVRAGDGKLMWSYPIERTTSVIPTPIVRGDLVFFTAGYGRGGALLRQSVSSGGDVEIEEVYPLNTKLANKHGGVVLVGEHLYADSGDNGVPFCADFMTGEIAWKHRGRGRGSASVTAADGHLVFLFSNSVVSLLKASPSDYEELSSFELPNESERPSWAHPVIAGGRLFLREDDRIYCYAVGQ